MLNGDARPGVTPPSVATAIHPSEPGSLCHAEKLLMLFVALSLSLAAGLAAAVEVNTAKAALESVKGLGT